MTGFETNATDRYLKAWLNAGPLDRGVGDGLTFVATVASASKGKDSWVLRYRFGGREKEKTLGRYPDVSLKDARELARKDRALLQQGVDIAALKRREELKAVDMHNVEGLAQIWYERHILDKYKHPQVVERVIRRHVKPAFGKLLWLVIRRSLVRAQVAPLAPRRTPRPEPASTLRPADAGRPDTILEPAHSPHHNGCGCVNVGKSR